jgi:hypothetical protein
MPAGICRHSIYTITTISISIRIWGASRESRNRSRIRGRNSRSTLCRFNRISSQPLMNSNHGLSRWRLGCKASCRIYSRHSSMLTSTSHPRRRPSHPWCGTGQLSSRRATPRPRNTQEASLPKVCTNRRLLFKRRINRQNLTR